MRLVHYRVSNDLVVTDLIKEEDFVANLYHRKLLTDLGQPEIDQTLDDAIAHLKKESTTVKGFLKDALISRLELRRQILSAVQIDDILDPQKASFWGRCVDILPTLKSTTQLGTSVDQSFSIKTQRRLASTVPPRPLVKISFDNALVYLTELCQYGKDIYGVLDYHSGPNLLVSNTHYLSQ